MAALQNNLSTLRYLFLKLKNYKGKSKCNALIISSTSRFLLAPTRFLSVLQFVQTLALIKSILLLSEEFVLV